MSFRPAGAGPLLLAGSFPPARGGIETLLYETTRRMQPPPVVVAPEPAAAPHGDLVVRSIKTMVPGLAHRAAYRLAWPIHPSLHYLSAYWRAAFDAVYAHHPTAILCGHVYLLPLAVILARRIDRPVVAFAYGQEVWRGGRSEGFPEADARLRGAALRAADAIVVPGTFTAGLLDDWEVAPSRVFQVAFGAEPRPESWEPTGATLLSVARLVPRKGIDTVIRALPEILQHVPGVRYRVVGTGPDERRLRSLAEQVGVEARVTFLGRVDDVALAREYQDATLFVLPSRRTEAGDLEGLGLVYLEAAAWGRPSLAGMSGGECDAVEDGVTGILVDGTSVSAVASAAISVLGDRARLRRMGVAARRRVETTHNWDAAARRVDSILRVLVTG